MGAEKMQDKIIKKAAVVTITSILLIVALTPSINSVSINKTNLKSTNMLNQEVTYDVFFGTISPPPKVVSNQSETTYNPGTLEHNTTYYWQIVAWNDLSESAEGSIWHFTTEVGLPSVETLNADPVGKTNATLNGKILEDGGDTCKIRFRYKEEGETEWIYPSDWHGSYNTDDTFSEYIDGLNLSTLYDFEAGVKNLASEEWGETKNFTTNANQPPVAVISAPSSADKKTSITFDGSGSYDPDGTITDYAWEFGDGNTDTGVVVSHSYQVSGPYTITLQVTDDDGAIGVVTHSITINNNAPVASWVADYYYIEPGQTVTFDGTGSYDPNGDSLTYEWKLGDGTIIGTDAIITYTFHTSGTFQVILTVTDDDPNNPMSDSYSGMIYVNSPPIADAGPDQVVNLFTGMPVQFDGSGSYDPDGTIVEYFWDFDDGETGYGMIIEHSYSTNEEFIVTLTVTDDQGATGDDTCIITVVVYLPDNDIDNTRANDILPQGTISSIPPNTPSNPYPEDGAIDVPIDVVLSWTGGQNHRPEPPIISGPTSGNPGTPYDYTFIGMDPDGDQIYYFIDWGDHTVEEWIGPFDSEDPQIVSHTWETKGTYTIQAKAKDTHGAEGEVSDFVVNMPRNKAIQRPFFNFLENHLNLFPILRLLLQKLGL